MKKNTNKHSRRMYTIWWQKGFTFLEILIVILLTALVISMAFLYLNTFNKYISQINSSVDYELDVLRFESLLYYDIDRSTDIRYEANRYLDISSAALNISYELEDYFIVRNQENASDTLFCEFVEFVPHYFKGSDTRLSGLTFKLTDYKLRVRQYTYIAPRTSRLALREYWMNHQLNEKK